MAVFFTVCFHAINEPRNLALEIMGWVTLERSTQRMASFTTSTMKNMFIMDIDAEIDALIYFSTMQNIF